MAEIFAAYADDLEARGKPAERVRDAWKRLAPTFAAMLPEHVSRLLSRAYVAERRREGAGDGTIRRELGALRSALRWQSKATPAVVELPSPPPSRDRFLTRDEYAALLGAAQSDHIRLFIILALATAARKTAILELTWDRVDFAGGRIDLGGGSGNKRRGVKPMTQRAREALEFAYAARTCEHVIEYRGGPVLRIDKAFRRTVERSGIPHCGPHDLRRSAARWMVESGVPIEAVSQYLDHTDVRTTMKTYARFSPDFLAGAAQALEV